MCNIKSTTEPWCCWKHILTQQWVWRCRRWIMGDATTKSNDKKCSLQIAGQRVSDACFNAIWSLFPAVTRRASTKWQSGCFSGSRRSWREWSREPSSAWGARSICSSSRPWTATISAVCSQGGRPGFRPQRNTRKTTGVQRNPSSLNA